MKTPRHSADRTPDAPRAGDRMTRDFDLEIRSVDDAGAITGYASVFDVKTSYGEVMAPGSFTRTLAAWKAKGLPIPVLWQHDSYEPIGATTEITEDEHGLRIKADLITEVQRAAEAHALAKRKVLGGLSIGFSIPTLAADGNPAVVWDEDRQVEVFREVRLWEYSMVTFPANEAATIDEVRRNTSAAEELASAMRALRTELTRDRATAPDAAALLREARALMIATKPDRPARPATDQRALTALLSEARSLIGSHPRA